VRNAKKRRLRIDSSATSLTPVGFPYRNAAPLLDADAAWSTSGGSDNGVRGDNSSEDVDLDLSMGWEPSQSVAHVGIDMSGGAGARGSDQLQAPAVIRRSASYDREGPVDFGSGWSFNPTQAVAPPINERQTASLGRNSIRGLLERALRSPTWSVVSGTSTSPPSRRGSATTWARSTTTAATTPRTPYCDDPADEHRLDVADDVQPASPPARLPFRLINAFRDSQPIPSPTTPTTPLASTSAAGLGISNLLATPPGSPVPRVDISAPEDTPEEDAAHVRFVTSTPHKQCVSASFLYRDDG
jgi:hypothetical protein